MANPNLIIAILGNFYRIGFHNYASTLAYLM
jgi:hypothetical protein